MCNSKGYVERVISLPSLEREGSTFSGVTLLASQRWCFGTFVCTSMGYVESVERGILIQGSLCSPLKSGVFFYTFGCTGKGYIGRELLLLFLRERGVLIQGSLCSPLKSGGFGGTFECTWLRVER